MKAIDEDLKLLQVKAVDLLLIHAPYKAWGEPWSNCSKGPAGKAARQATWRGMEAVVKAGKARSIGVSNYAADSPADHHNYLQDVMDIASIPPAVNQCGFCVGFDDNATTAYCKKHKITYQAYSPLGGPDIGGKPVMDFKEVKAIAAAHGKSAAQVALRWVLQQGHALVTATVDPSYVKEDLDLWSWKLSDSEMRQLNSVRSGAPPAR